MSLDQSKPRPGPSGSSVKHETTICAESLLERLTQTLEGDRRPARVGRRGVYRDPSVDDEAVVAPLVVLEHLTLAMVVTVVLERDLEFGPGHVHAPQETTVWIPNVDVQLGFGESCIDQRQSEPRLHGGLRPDSNQVGRSSGIDRGPGTRDDRRREIVDRRGELGSPNEVIPDGDECSQPEQGGTLRPGRCRRGEAQSIGLRDVGDGEAVRDDVPSSHPRILRSSGHVHGAAVLHGTRERGTPQPGSGGVTEELVWPHDERKRLNEGLELIGTDGDPHTMDRGCQVGTTKPFCVHSARGGIGDPKWSAAQVSGQRLQTRHA